MGRWLAAILGREQEQWFLWGPVGFGLGIGLYFSLDQEPPAILGFGLAGLACVGYLAGRSRGLWQPIVGLLAAILLGMAAAMVRTVIVDAPILDRVRGPLTVKGFVELVEPRATGGQRITLRVVAIDTLAKEITPLRVRLRLRNADTTLVPGLAIAIKGQLSPPAAPASPGDFDFGRQAYFQRLGAVGFASGPATLTPELGAPPRSLAFQLVIERIRQAIAERILAALPGQAGHIALALITGERGGITEATNQAWRDAGLFHILSISGLHMVILAGSLFWLVRFALAMIPALTLNYRIKKWAAFVAILGALAYLLISGGAFATLRSWIMITIIFGAVIVDRPALALRNVALAALVILALWPESLLDAGFQMSFAAVVALISVFEWLRVRRERQGADQLVRRGMFWHARAFLFGIVASTLVASVAVAPFSAYHFHSSQQYALLANLIAIPLCNAVVMPAALGVFLALPFGLEALPLWIMGLGIEWIGRVAELTAQLPGATIKIPSISRLGFFIMIGGGLWLLLWQHRWRIAGAAVFIAGLAIAPFETRPAVLVGADGTLVAVRGADGRLTAVAARGQAFVLQRWLDADGDGRARDVVASAKGFACDGAGCIAMPPALVNARRIAVSNGPQSLRDDCATAGVLILRYSRPRPCWGSSAIVIDVDDLATEGTHALYSDTRAWRVATVERTRGHRPWSRLGQKTNQDLAQRLTLRALETFARQGARLGGFAGLEPQFDDEDDDGLLLAPYERRDR